MSDRQNANQPTNNTNREQTKRSVIPQVKNEKNTARLTPRTAEHEPYVAMESVHKKGRFWVRLLRKYIQYKLCKRNTDTRGQ